MPNYVVSEILKNRKITDYLSRKGHHPVGTISNGRLKYRCPLHTGDNTPSFTVYLNSEHENFFCFGCKARYSIIHLYRDLEKISTQDAIKALAAGLDLDVDAEIAHAVREINEDRKLMHGYNIVEASFVLNRQLYDFLKEVAFEPSCVASAEKIFTIIDRAVDQNDVETLTDLEEPLMNAIIYKCRWYTALREKRIMDLAKEKLH